MPTCQNLVKRNNCSGKLPLHVAIDAGNLLIVQHLVEYSHGSNFEPLKEQNNEDNAPTTHELGKQIPRFGMLFALKDTLPTTKKDT